MTAVYLRDTISNREYIIQIKVAQVERGDDVKKGDTFRAYCDQPKETRPIPHASGHSKVPKEGDEVRDFVKRNAGHNAGVYKNWIDIINSPTNVENRSTP